MDPLGILAAVVALAVYPGGLFLAGILWFGGGLPWRSTSAWRPSLRDLAALPAIDVAVAGAPLPASPAASLPPAAGAAPDIVVVALLVAASVVLVAPGRWHVRRLLCAAGVATTASLSVIAAASLALTTIAGEPGVRMAMIRALAAVAILVAAPQLCGSPVGASVGRRAVLAGTALLGLSLLLPAGLSGWAALAGAAAAAAATVGYVAVIGAAARALARADTALSTACGALGAAAIVVLVVVGR